jgi:PAS domain S-box-containing protein
MAGKDSRPEQAASLRQRAETAFRDNIAQPPDYENATPEETRRMLHELRVHQIELQMQNEELRRSQVELDAARERYFDLYDLAPVGYLAVSEAGLILEANLTAATLLGVSRGAVVMLPLSKFIHKEDQDSYHLHRKQLLDSGAPHAFELRMANKDGTTFWAHLETTMAHNRLSSPGQDGESRPFFRSRSATSMSTSRRK